MIAAAAAPACAREDAGGGGGGGAGVGAGVGGGGAGGAGVCVCFVRHGEGAHNVGRDYSIPDPGLTPRGRAQAAAAGALFRAHAHRLPHGPALGAVVASPLRRTIQTALEGFGDLIAASDAGRLVVRPELQEVNLFACDTGQPPAALRAEFAAHHALDLTALRDDWMVKPYAQGHEGPTVRARFAEFLRWLEGAFAGRTVVVVSHFCLLRIGLSGAVFRNCELRTFLLSGGTLSRLPAPSGCPDDARPEPEEQEEKEKEKEKGETARHSAGDEGA